MDAEKFGAFIAAARKEKNMTQKALAEKLHVTDKAVSRWERGLGFPDIHTIEPLAEALGVSLLELLHAERETAAPDAGADARRRMRSASSRRRTAAACTARITKRPYCGRSRSSR